MVNYSEKAKYEQQYTIEAVFRFELTKEWTGQLSIIQE